MASPNSIAYPQIQPASFQAISPSVHWAQAHQRDRHSFHISRRIYDYELLYIQKGTVSCKLDGDLANYTFMHGDLILIPAGVHHELLITDGESADFLGIHFDFFDELAIAKDEDIIVNEDEVALANFCKTPDIKEWGGTLPLLLTAPAQQMISYIETVIHEFSQKRLGYELICKGLMLSIISHLYRGQQQSSVPTPDAYADKLQSIIQSIETNCAADWSNTKIGLLLNIHEDYMAKLFKNKVGMSPNKYVQWVRHQEAKRHLRENNNKISSISHTVGYEDTAYFCRVFKKYESMSPEQYRKYSKIL